jgi:hypothetical protein
LFDKHHGMRVVMGQRALQSEGDVMLGPTPVDGRPFSVRQMKNMKGGLDVAGVTGEPFYLYVQNCGMLLARAHARVGDAAAINGYIGKSSVFDEAREMGRSLRRSDRAGPRPIGKGHQAW